MLARIITQDVRKILHDIVHHFLYSVFLIGFSTLITYFFLGKFISQKLIALSTTPPFQNNQTIQSFLTAQQTGSNEVYTERGSPYDNRTVNGQTQGSQVIFHGPRDKKQIALTFDAEMTEGMKASYLSGQTKSSYDKRVIDVLNQTNTKATLFLTGMWIELYPKETTEFAKNPLFEIGSHSYTDTSFHGFCYGLQQIDKTIAIEQIGAAEKLIREHAGINNQLFRFPGGCYTPEDVDLVVKAGDTVVHWDVVGADGFNENTQQIVNNVVGNAQNGSIIVLHMNGAPTAPKTAEALPEIIKQLKAKGFEFVKINEMLGMPAEKREGNL